MNMPLARHEFLRSIGNGLILCREPRAEEKAIAQEFLKTSPLDELCRAVFNLNEFVYAE